MLTTGYFHDTITAKFLTGSSLDFLEICAEVLVPKFTRADSRLPGYMMYVGMKNYPTLIRVFQFHFGFSN